MLLNFLLSAVLLCECCLSSNFLRISSLVVNNCKVVLAKVDLIELTLK